MPSIRHNNSPPPEMAGSESLVAVGEHRESDTTITVWDDEKSAWRSIPLTRLTELRIDGERLEVA